MSVPDGGPAFPRPFSDTGERHGQRYEAAQAGLSLRDYFAAAALPAVIAARVANQVEDLVQDSIAEECYELADALLAARERETA